MVAAFFIFIASSFSTCLRWIRRIHIRRTVWALVAIFSIAINILLLANEVRLAHSTEAAVVSQGKQQMTVTVTPSDPASLQRTFRVVLICDTPDSRSNGLQGFRKLKRDEAALFIFDEPEIATFWMASVTFPIDIIFVGPEKKVTRVYADRKPGSKDLYPSGKPAKWVIETAAGSKIQAGDRVSFK
jgi:uncharacterized membrane protein (UPF0127 family)